MFIIFSTSIKVGSLDVENAEIGLYSSVRYYSKYLYELAWTIKLLHDVMFFYRSYWADGRKCRKMDLIGTFSGLYAETKNIKT